MAEESAPPPAAAEATSAPAEASEGGTAGAAEKQDAPKTREELEATLASRDREVEELKARLSEAPPPVEMKEETKEKKEETEEKKKGRRGISKEMVEIVKSKIEERKTRPPPKYKIMCCSCTG